MMLADTNLIIYATRPDYAVVSDWLVQTVPACSAITRVEALGYHRLNDDEHRAIDAIFASLRLIYPTTDTFERAIQLRRQRKMTLGDALIAATAMQHNLTLATANRPGAPRLHKAHGCHRTRLWEHRPRHHLP